MKKIIAFLCITHISFLAAQDISLSAYTGLVNTKIDKFGDLGQQFSSNVYYRFNKDFTMFLSTGYYEWQEDYGINGSDFSSVPLLIGIRLPITYDYTFPYFSAEMGFQYVKRTYSKGTFEQTNIPNEWIVTSQKTIVDTDISFQPRVTLGMLAQITEKLAVDVAFKYSLSNYEYTYFYYNGSFFPGGKTKRVFLYDIGLGIIYYFE